MAVALLEQQNLFVHLSLKIGDKGIKKWLKISIIVVVVISSLGFGGYYLLITKPVQNLIGRKVLAGLSERTDTEFKASYIHFSNFKKIEIRDLYVEDKNQDTLLYASRAYATIDSINYSTRFVRIQSIELESPTINILQNDSGVFNFMFIVDSLGNNDNPDSLKWHVDFHDIKLIDGDFSLAQAQVAPIDLHAIDFSATIDQQHILLNQFGFGLDNGFRLEKSYADIDITPQRVNISQLSLASEHSALIFRNIALYSEDSLLKNTPKEELQFKLQSNNSFISGRDISYFLTDAFDLSHSLIIDGTIDGDLDELKGHDLHFKVDSLLKINSQIEIKNIADFTAMTFNIKFDELLIDIVESAKIYNQIQPEKPFDVTPYAHWQKLGLVGEVAGNSDTITTVGAINTRYGTLTAELMVSLPDEIKGLAYSGDISTRNFHVGRALENTEVLGRASAQLSMTGGEKSDGKFDNYFKGEISALTVKDYTYSDIRVEGGVGKGYFNGILDVKDENANFDFSGEIDFLRQRPTFNFTLNMKHLALVNLKLIDTYQQLDVSFMLNSKLKGNKVDNINGFLNIDTLLVQTEHASFKSDSISLAFKPLDTTPSIVFSSEYINGLILGSYNFSELLGYLNTSMKQHLEYLPQQFEIPKSETTNEFDYIFEVQDMQSLATTLDLPLRANGFSVISGAINSEANTFTFESDIPYILTKKQILDSISISIKNSNSLFTSDVNIGTFTFGRERVMKNVSIKNNIKQDTILFSTNWNNGSDKVFGGDYNAKIWLEPYGRDSKTIIESQPSDFIISNTPWKLNKHRISFLSKHIDVDSLIFRNDQSLFFLDGIASDKLTDTMRLEMDHFELGNLDRFLNIKNFNFAGILSGNAELYSLLDKPVVVTDITIDSTVVNASVWGNLTAASSWNAESSALGIYADCESLVDGERLLAIEGGYYQDVDSLDLFGDFNNFDIRFLYPYLKSTMSNLKGWASGQLDVKGSIRNPELYGALGVDSGGFRIDYLSTDFFLDDTIKFDKGRFVFDKTQVQDQEGNLGTVTGDVRHTRYKHMLVDISIESDRFMGLNTTAIENEYFYGDIFFGGAITIQSTGTETTIASRARTRQGSFLTVPLSPVSTAATNNFINYVVKAKDTVEVVDEPRLMMQSAEDTRALIIDMNFNVTSEALLRLEFEAESGDVIESTGNGNLNIKFQKGQPFQMFGEYEIVKGEYLLRKQIFNKTFSVNAGSSLRWSGRPGNAIVDIIAMYPTRASLYNLMPDAVNESNKNRRVPVNVKMLLEKRLSQPDISFDIELPNTDAETQQSVSSIINTEEEMNRQVLSLLIMNGFYTPDYYRDNTNSSTSNNQFSNAAAVTASELLSSQLSHWMSQISDDFVLGFNYTPEQKLTDEGLTPQEIQMAISTQLFNDRLTVNVNGAYQGYAEETRPSNVNSNFVGEVDVELKLNQHLKLRAYSHQNDDIFYENSSMKQGAALTYQEDFTTVKELVGRYKKRINSLFEQDEKRNSEAIIKEDEDFVEEENIIDNQE